MLKLYFVIVAQSCPTLCDPMDSGLSGFSAHGDFPAKNALLHKLYFTTFKSGICHVLSLHSLTYDSFSTSVRPSCLFIVLLSHCYYQFFFFLTGGLHFFFFFGDAAWQNSEMGPNGLQSCCWQGCTALESYSTEFPCLLETSRPCLQVLSLLLFLSPSRYGWYSVVHVISF